MKHEDRIHTTFFVDLSSVESIQAYLEKLKKKPQGLCVGHMEYGFDSYWGHYDTEVEVDFYEEGKYYTEEEMAQYRLEQLEEKKRWEERKKRNPDVLYSNDNGNCIWVKTEIEGDAEGKNF